MTLANGRRRPHHDNCDKITRITHHHCTDRVSPDADGGKRHTHDAEDAGSPIDGAELEAGDLNKGGEAADDQ